MTIVSHSINKLVMFFRLLIILFVSLLLSKEIFGQSPRIFINEFIASNLTTNPDMVDFDDFSDWIELYNDENTNVNIGGFYITDDFSQPQKWQIPTNTIIPAKGYFLIWADGYNDTPGKTYLRDWWPHDIQYTTKWCHTNFQLNKDGDEIGLYDSGGNKIDSVSFSDQETDVSYGRKPDGSSNWFYFGEPTPLSPNTKPGFNSTSISGVVDFSIEGGFYPNSVQVSLSSSSGSGVIRYTTDGSKPTSSSNQYITPLNISNNIILRARVFENSKLPGKVITNSYFIGETRNLPAVSLVTNPLYLWGELGIYKNTYKDREIPVSLEYFPLGSQRAFSLDAGARIGGENIYRFAEKPFNIYANSGYGYSHISYKIFNDLPYQEYKRLYLRNSGDDWPFTMFRDGLCETILKDQIPNSMQAFEQSVLYLNGQYWGIYNLREKIDDQYFLIHYNVDPADLDHLESDYTIITGDSTDFVNLLNLAQETNLADSVNYAYFSSKIDIHNLMDFVIVQDFIANSSWGHNREEWRDRKNENLWRWVLVDMDRGFDANRISDDRLTDIYTNFGLFRELSANENFKNEFIQRYAERMNHVFNPDRVIPIIDSLKSVIENEMPRHIQKWGTYIDSLTIDIWGQTPGVTSLTSWNSEVQKLKNFATGRSQYASQYLSSRFGLSGRANLKISTNVQNQGKVVINGFFENIGEDNLYFKDAPIPIKIYSPPGYSFKQWKEIVLPSLEENIISANPSISYTLRGETELIAEFEKIDTDSIPGIINSALTLTKANSDYYYVPDNVTIGSNGVLTVDPGVIIYFSRGKGITVHGKLLFNGTESEPITLTSYYPSDKWGAISFDYSIGTSELNYVNISNSTSGIDTINFFAGVSSYYSTVHLTNVNFDNVKLPISSQWSDMIINSCRFENVSDVGDYINCNGGNLTVFNSVFKGNDFPDMDALDLGFTDGAVIQNNIIMDFTGNNSDGIDLGDGSINTTIENNTILNCGDKGVSIGQGSKALLLRNAIAGCNLGVGIKDSLSYGNILNCTFFSDNVGIACFEKNKNDGGGKADVKNSIFASSSNSSFTVDDKSSITINYSISNTEVLPGQGNLFDEPLMINPDGANFHIQTGSPCIDNGDPQTQNDNDGTRVDIGAFMYAGDSAPTVVINEINYNSSNDFDSEDWIELYNNTSDDIDVSGWVFMDENRTPSFAIDSGTILQSHSFIVLCRDLTLFRAKYPAVSNVVGNLNSGLSGGGEVIFLYDTSGRLVDSLTYDDKEPWPVEADGGGSSLELKDPNFNNALGINWAASIGHGTPGSVNSVVTDVNEDNSNSIPDEFLLLQNYPNPFNSSTNIKFQIPEESWIKLVIYNILGKQITEITEGDFSPGIYSFKWDGNTFSSGIYFLQMNAQSKTSNKNYNSVKKLILLK